MAISAGKQPQQFFISSYFSRDIDLSLNIEGFNELTSQNYPHRPLEFPSLPISEMVTDDKTLQTLYFGRLVRSLTIAIGEKFQKLTYFPKNTIFFLYKTFFKLKRKLDQKLFMSKETTDKLALKEWYNGEKLSIKQLNKAKIKTWYHYSNSQYLLFKSLKKKSLFILQPNLWVPKSKPFSDQEKKFKHNSPFSPKTDVANSYRLAKLLSKEALFKLHDFSNIFEDTTETVYQDNCCHLNEKGNYILINNIVEIIKESVPH